MTIKDKNERRYRRSKNAMREMKEMKGQSPLNFNSNEMS